MLVSMGWAIGVHLEKWQVSIPCTGAATLYIQITKSSSESNE